MKNILTLVLFSIIFCNHLIAQNAPLFTGEKIFDRLNSVDYSTDEILNSATQEVDKTLNNYAIFDITLYLILIYKLFISMSRRTNLMLLLL